MWLCLLSRARSHNYVVEEVEGKYIFRECFRLYHILF